MSESRRKSKSKKQPHLRKRTSSKFHHSFVRAKLKLTNTKQSVEPQEITHAKSHLKSIKNITTCIEPIVTNLYWAHHEESRLTGTLCTTLTNLTISGDDDKFGIFLKNMGRVQQNLQEIDEMYLIDMKDQFLDPLKQFNNIEIKNCQSSKLKLKTIKGEFDLKKKNENKLLKSNSEKRINLEKIHNAQSVADKKLSELKIVRNEFISTVENMNMEKLQLVDSIQEYMLSFAAYSKIHSTNIALQHKMMNVKPPSIVVSGGSDANTKKNGLDSDTEECYVNDFDEIQNQSTLNDWSKTSVVVKEGIFKKRGAVNKSFKRRWFKLFTNKKLTYFELNDGGNAPSGMLRGHANLTKIMSITSKKKKLIEIQTKTRKWVFQYGNSEDRDGWYVVFHQTCVQDQVRTMAQTAHDFGEMFVGNDIIAPCATTTVQCDAAPAANIHINTHLLQSTCDMDVNMTIARTSLYNKHGKSNNTGKSKRLRFNYPSKVRNCGILNNGHTIEINIDCEENKCLLFYNNWTYFLSTLYVHTPAEHTVDGKRYDMECHLVHSNEINETVVLCFVFSSKQQKKNNPARAYGHIANKSSKLSYHLMAPVNKRALLGGKKKLKLKQSALNVPEFTDDDESSDDETDTENLWDVDEKYDINKENDFLAQFWDELPLRETKNDILLSKSLCFDYLFESAGMGFEKNVETNEIQVDMELIEYTGALTTPPYTDGVQFVIAKKTHFIGLKQLNKLSLCWGQL